MSEREREASRGRAYGLAESLTLRIRDLSARRRAADAAAPPPFPAAPAAAASPAGVAAGGNAGLYVQLEILVRAERGGRGGGGGFFSVFKHPFTLIHVGGGPMRGCLLLAGV